MSTAADALARERDAKFKAWLQNKALKDKAFEFLGKLNSQRAIEEESLIEVAISLCAVDRLLGGDEDKKGPNEGMGEDKKDLGTSAKKTLKSAWFRWAMEFHSFNMIHLSDADVAGLSGGVREFLTSEADLIASGGNYGEELERASRTKNILPSLKYFFPAVPKPNEKAKPLTNDQKAQNLIFMREARKLWRKAEDELKNRVTEFVAKTMKAGGKKGSILSAQNSVADADSERDAKGRADRDVDSRGDSGKFESPEERMSKMKKIEALCLQELSLKQLKIWLEEDQDAILNKANEDAMEKIKLAKSSHEQFVKRKDGLRIRMPDTIPTTNIPSMGYGKELTGVRAQVKGVSTTVDLMAGMGLKYVHATNKGRKGQMGDLEKSRDQLLKMGFIDKSNFDEEDKHLYDRERRENSVIKEKQALEAKTREENTKAYDEWIVQKELRDSALKCLALVPRPVAEMPVLHDDVRGSAASLKKSASAALATTNPMQNPTLSRHCLDVGRAMKKVDRTTFLDWAKWCEGVFSVNTAQVLWDYFPPLACDVHCASYSQVRDTFLKLLRPGVDFRQTFMDYVEKHIFARRINRFKDEKEYYRLREDAQAELDEEMESMRKEWLSEVSLSKEDMGKLLLTMGISLKETEMRALIDAFDVNCDGVITIAEFLEFTGPKRDKRSGNSVVMSQRCCWLTTCKVTGMPGAYSVSAPTKRSQKQEEMKSSDDMYYHRTVGATGPGGGSSKNNNNRNAGNDEDAEVNSKLAASTLGNVNIVVRQLANGEKRMCIELKERKKREELLKKMGLIDDQGKPISASNNARAKGERNAKARRDATDEIDPYGENEFETDEPDPYGEDFEDGDNDSSDGRDKGKGGKGGSTKSNSQPNPSACDYSSWSTVQRRAGLKFMLAISKDAREETALKVLLANGVPPAPPKLWVQNEHFVDTKSVNRSKSGGYASGANSVSGNSSKFRGESKMNLDDEDNNNNEADATAGCTEITLFWGTHNKGDLVSFYSLEYGGVVGNNTTSNNPAMASANNNNVKYVEIFRDPEDANPSSPFACNYTLRDLTPGASYRFRLRAFNGFGAGEYTYKTFTTLTAAPALPRVIKTCSDSVTLKWTFSKGFFRRIEDLKRIFTLADSDHSGCVSREELALLLDERASGSPELKVFLNKVATSVGIVVENGYEALFDMIEGDDDGLLSWLEFENFFMAAGWGSAGATGGNNNNTSNAPFTPSGILQQSSMRTSTGPAGAGITIAPGDINYVVERCESEIDGKYTEVLRTTLGHGTLTRLEPGRSYRFRVHSLNADGVAGPPSPSVLVHTLIETPAAPVAPPKFVQARKVTLVWKARNTFVGTRNKAFTDKMLNEWAGALGEDESGVSIRAAFDKYDRDGSGDIDSAELRLVLTDLGVEASDERLNEAFQLLDYNGDGIISYDEFAKWWRRDAVSYTLKRSEEVLPLNSALYVPLDNGTNRFRTGTVSAGLLNTSNNIPTTVARSVNRGNLTGIAEEGSVRSVSRGGTRPQSANGNNNNTNQNTTAVTSSTRQAAVPIVTYRGDRTRYDVKGLTPNRLYHFRLRYVGSRSNSILSPPLVLMTAPLPTSAPILVDVTSQTVRIKWYPGQYGAFKFIVHMRLESSSTPTGGANLNNTAASASALSSTRKVATGLVGADTGEEGWIAVYNGQDNVFTAPSLASATAYQVRVVAVNCQGNVSEPSEIVNFTTLQRSEVSALTPKNAGARFTIECTADICVGDVILITERLYVKNRLPVSSGVAGNNAALNNSTSNVRSSINSTTSLRGKSPGKSRLNASAPVAGARSGQINPQLSVTSLNGMGLDAGASITCRGDYLGERTIAAYVARDNYRTIRDALHSANVEPRHHKTFGTHRQLWLEVVWQRTSDEACKPYDLKSGEVLERMQGHLEQFEVFRCAWREENKRKPLQEEWRAMSDCFVQTDC